ncbi:MAG: DEAD/DEAH box helicase [Candidatus Omnitrophota bacterium]
MEIKSLSKKFNLPEELVKTLESAGLTSFYPPQAMAIKRGILDGGNFVLSCPTASGKTLVAELCMLKDILLHKNRCLYVVPLRALASEKYEDFKQKYSRLNIKVNISTGEFDTSGRDLGGFDILIATCEKVDSLLRQRCEWLTNNLGTVVFDEVHFLNDPSRGPTLEILISRIRQLNSRTQILALSATISNAVQIAKWLNAQLIETDWRPVPLKEGVYFEDKINFDDGTSRIINLDIKHDIAKLALDTVGDGGQALVFVNTRVSTQTQARLISKEASGFIKESDKKALTQISKEILNTLSEPTKICRRLAETVAGGIAFHHAGLHPKQRKIVEDYFKKNIIKVICATPTLAAGVNLPSRRTIIRDFKRYSPGLGQDFIPVFEYKQFAGRAGRPQYDKVGESVLVAKTALERKMLFSEYVYKDPEPIQSRLNNVAALRTHVLSCIASGFTHTRDDLSSFFKTTFYAFQNNSRDLSYALESILNFLKNEGLIKESPHNLKATIFGILANRLYINPLSAVIIRNGLKKARTNTKYFSLLHLACCCPEIEALALNRNDYEGLNLYYDMNADELLLSYDDLSDLFDLEDYLGQLKTALMLEKWMEEEKEEIICEEFKVGPGDIRRIIESADWLVYCCHKFARLLGHKELLAKIDQLSTRINYGIKEELLELVGLRGVGRVRARSLYNHGFNSLFKIRNANIKTLDKIPHIGKKIAINIKEQLLKNSLRLMPY